MSDVDESVKGLIKSGKNDRVSAELLGLTRHKVRKARIELGLDPVRTHGVTRRNEEAEKRKKVARELRNQGWTFRAIAEEFGVSKQAVHQWLRG